LILLSNVKKLWHTGLAAINPVGPSAMQYTYKDKTYHVPAMTLEDFEQVRNAYVAAAVKAKQIGCDAIEIHGGKDVITCITLQHMDICLTRL
jgi:2,4-dienoyl-CoA reductase-like NADH-dependent reductase (Old Yellow Enzyme family)